MDGVKEGYSYATGVEAARRECDPASARIANRRYGIESLRAGSNGIAKKARIRTEGVAVSSTIEVRRRDRKSVV